MKHKIVIKETLEQLLESKGATMAEMSRETEIPYCRIVSWRFKNNPTASWELMAAAKYFKVPLNYLLFGIWDIDYKPTKEALKLR